jgi:hypothetical protein
MNPQRKNQGVGVSNPLSRQILKHLSELSVGAIGRNSGSVKPNPTLCAGDCARGVVGIMGNCHRYQRRCFYLVRCIAQVPAAEHPSGEAIGWHGSCSLAARSLDRKGPAAWRSGLAARSSGVHLFYKTFCALNTALRLPSRAFDRTDPVKLPATGLLARFGPK